MSLDLSYNDLLDLDATLKALKPLPNLRVLLLQGNPFCVLPAYRAKVRL
jgi:Leucine-rich repeat (LRR) protein